MANIRDVYQDAFNAVNEFKSYVSNNNTVSSKANPAKSAYQANLTQPTQTQQNNFSTRFIMGQIATLSMSDKPLAQEYYQKLQYSMADPNSHYYNPYNQPTNKAVNNLAALGFDTNNLNDNWWNANQGWVTQNLLYNGTTNSPSKPGKKATWDQNVAYELYQWHKSEDTTKKAEQQWEALQQELTYLAQDESRNYSDDQILAMIDWSKYSELAKMDKDKYMSPTELNRAIGYSEDAMYGVLWKARNHDEKTDLWNAMAYSALGEGKHDSTTYSPYEVGMTATEAGKYFGVYEFDRDTLDNIAANLDWNDETAVRYYHEAEQAYENTQKLDAQLTAMYEEIATLEKSYSRPQDVIDIIKSNQEYKDLFALDETMNKGPKYGSLVPTSSAVDYKWDKIEQKILADYEERKKQIGVAGTLIANGVLGSEFNVPTAFAPEGMSPDEVRNEAKQIVRERVLSSWESDETTQTNVNLTPEQLRTAYDEKYGNGAYDNAIAMGTPVTLDQEEGLPINTGEIAQNDVSPSEDELRAAYDSKYGSGAYDKAMGSAATLSQADIAMEEDVLEKLTNLEPVVQNVGTDGEKLALQTGKTSFWSKAFQTIKEANDYRQSMNNSIKRQINDSYVDDVRTIYDYEEHQKNRDYAQSELDRINPEYISLSNRIGVVEGVNNLAPEEYNNLMSLPQSENWGVWENILAHPERAEQDANQAELYDQALLYLYQQTKVDENGMHDYGYSDMGVVREVAPKLFEYLQSVTHSNEQNISPIDQARQQAIESGEYTVDLMIPFGGEDRGEDEDTYYTVKFRPDDNGNLEFVMAVGNVTGDPIADEKELNDALGYIAPVQPLTAEEMQRYEILADKKAEEEKKLAEEEKYLRDHEASYSSSVRNKNSLEQATMIAQLTNTGVNSTLLSGAEITVKAAQIGGNIMPAPYSMYDKYVMDGAMTREEASTNSAISAHDNLLYAQQIRETLETLDEDVLSDEERKNAAACADALEREGKAASFTALDGNADFGGMFALGRAEATKDTGLAKLLTYAGTELPERESQAYYDLQNQLIKENALNSTDLVLGWYNILEAISDEEVNRFFYLYKKDSPEDAEKYFNFINDPDYGELTVRKDQNWKQYLTEWSDKGALYAGGAWLASVGMKPVANVTSLVYRLSGGTSAYNQMASMRSDVDALRAGVENKVESYLGENTFWGNFGKRALRVGTGLADIWVNNKIVSGITSLFGGSASSVLDPKFTEAITSGENGVYSILGMSVDSSNATWDKVMRETNDVDKANKMSLVSFLSSMLTHTVVMKGIGNVLNADPKAYTSAIGEFTGNLVKNASAIGVSTAITETATKAIEAKILGEDSYWGKAFAKYKAMDYSDTMASYAADNDTLADTFDKVSEAVVDSLIRTTMTTAAKEIAPKVKEVTQSIKDKVDVLKNYYKPSIEGTPLVLEDENPYNVDWANKYTPGEVRWYKPSDGTQAFVRRVGSDDTFAITGYRYDRQTGNIYLINMAGDEILFDDVDAGFLAQFGNTEAGNATVGLFMDIAKNWDDRTGVFATPVTDPVPEEEENPYAVIVPENPQRMQKDITLAMNIAHATPTAAAVSVSGIINNKDIDIGIATGQSIVGRLADGDTMLTSVAMQGLVANGANREDISYASLTNGEGRKALESAFEKVKNGEMITPEDVKAIHDGIAIDRRGNPKGFEQEYQNAVKDSMISNRTIDIMRKNNADEATNKAREELKSEEEKLNNAKAFATALWSKFSTAGENLKRVESEYDPSVPDTAGPFQQARNEFSGLSEQVKQAQNTANTIQSKVDQAKDAVTAADNKAVSEARPEAATAAEQDSKAKREAEYNDSIANLKPLFPFKSKDKHGKWKVPFTLDVKDTEGRAVTLTGIYDYIAPHPGTTGEIVYSTADGRLVMESKTADRMGNHIDPLYGTVDTSEQLSKKEYNDFLNKIESYAINRQRNPLRPEIDINGTPVSLYFPTSFPIANEGLDIQMIGLVGKEISQNEAYPVILGIDGKKYGGADENYNLPYDNADDVYDLFYKYEDKLPVVAGEDITRITKEDVINDEGQTDLTVPGTEGTGSDGRQLVRQSGSDVGRGSVGDVEERSEGQNVGGVPEGEHGLQPPTVSRGDSRFFPLIYKRLPRDEQGRLTKSLNDPSLHETKDYKLFSSALAQHKLDDPHGAFVDAQSPEELKEKGAITIISPDGYTGAAVGTVGKEAGNIFGVFNNKTKNKKGGTMPFIMLHALEAGGNKLDCFDGVLSRNYTRYGFIPVARLLFNKEYAPEGWDYERDGTPDVVVWMHNGDSADTVARKYMFSEDEGGYHWYGPEEIKKLPLYDDYEEALAYRDSLMATRDRGEDLLYTHGLSPEHATMGFKNGGFTGISVGITKEDQGHSSVFNFGETNGNDKVLLVFDESTVDPEKHPETILFGGDGNTPMFPKEKIESRDGKFYIKGTDQEATQDDIMQAYKDQGDVVTGVIKLFKTLKEMKDESGRLTSDKSKAMEFSEPIEDVTKGLGDLFDGLSDEDKQYWIEEGEDLRARREKAGVIMTPEDAARRMIEDEGFEAISDKYQQDMTTEELQKLLSDYGINISPEAAEKFRDVLENSIRELDDYFEAKLMRTTGLEEVALAVIPKDETETIKAAEDAGVNYITYDPAKTTAQKVAAEFNKARREAMNAKTPTDDNGEPIITPPTQTDVTPPVETPAEITQPDVNAEATPSAPATPAPADTTPPPVNRATATTRVNIPKGPVRQWNTQGAQETNLLHDKIKQHLIENAAYDPRKNSEDIDSAITWVASHANPNDPNGFWTALTEATSEDFNPLSVDGQARMMVLMSMAAGDGLTDAEQRLADVYANARTEIGQALQIGKMYTLMTREGRKTYFLRMRDKAQDDYNSHRSKKNQIKLNISDELLEMAANAKTAEDFAKARKQLEKELGEQIPSDWALRMRNWRYFAMLQGTRTHVRNVVGNAAGKYIMLPMKNAIAAGLEKAGKVPVGERTKAIKLNPEAKAYAAKIAEKYKDALQGNAGGRYLELSGVEANRKAFGSGEGRTAVGRFISRTLGRAVQWGVDKNSAALEWEDWLFLKPHFINALASYMTANGYTEKDMTGKVFDRGLEYAMDEAKKATYRKFNKTAKWFSDPTNKPKGLQFAISALQPFAKTGMNIMKLGYEYSPFGLAQSILSAKKQLEAYKEWEDKGFKGKKPANAKSPGEVYDRIAEGLTGLGLAGIGVLLSSLGMLKIKATESEKRQGHQDYSLELFGYSFPISNLIPAVMPMMFGGAAFEAYEQFSEGDGDIGDVLNAISSMVEPSFETTLWSSWSGWLDSARTASDSSKTTSVLAEKLISNYISSYIPALGTGLARVIDPTQRKAYIKPGTNELEAVWSTLVEQTQNKLPFLSRFNVPYLDKWGEENTTDWFNSLLNNFILPDTIKKIEDSELDQLLEKIDAEPNSTNTKTLTVNTVKIPLDDQQWYQYSHNRGAYAKEVLDELIHRPEFLGIDNTEVQQELCKRVYKYANAKAALELFPEKNITDGWTKGALNANNVVDYIFEKEEESAKSEFITEHKKSLKLSITQDNVNAAGVDIDSLRTAGVEDSTIKTYVTKEIKPLYKKAYQEGDVQEVERLKVFLRNLDIGYEEAEFKKWVNVNEGSAVELHSNTKGKYYALGNIDINNRKVLQNPDGSISTEESFSFYDDDPSSPNYGKEVLIPSIIDGKRYNEDDAINYYYKTGEYLGAFDTPEEADEYAIRLHERQDWYYNR